MTTSLGILLLGAIFAGLVAAWRKQNRLADASARHPSVGGPITEKCQHRQTTPVGAWVHQCRCGIYIEREPKL